MTGLLKGFLKKVMVIKQFYNWFNDRVEQNHIQSWAPCDCISLFEHQNGKITQ
jgi:hypothetical protein